MIGLTARQQDALRFIAGFQAAKGYSPSYVEIAKGIGLSGETSKHAVYRLVTGLCERGAIRRLPHRERAIEVLVPVAIPRAPDGEPLHFIRIGESAA